MTRAGSKNRSIRQQSIHDLIALMEEAYQGEGLYVFQPGPESNKPPPLFPFRPDHFTFLLVLEGELRVAINLIEYIVQKDHLIVVTPDTVIEFREKSAGLKGIGVGFTSDFMFRTGIHKNHIDPFDFLASQANPDLQLEAKDTANLHKVFLLLLDKSLQKRSHPYGNELVNNAFSILMYEMAALHQHYNMGGSIHLNRKEHLAMRFLKLLPVHFREHRSVQYYAELLFVTPKYLTETIKEMTGKTAGEFIDAMVITEAKLMLADPAISVAGVAEALYFSDQAFFSKFFKRQAGISPTGYRKTIYK